MRSPLIPALIAAAAIALAGAGCGDDENSTTTVTETASSTSSSTESTTTDETVTESTGVTTTTPEGGEEGEKPDRHTLSTAAFTSPSGNIGCVIDRSIASVRCDIRDRDWQPPKAPADCDLDYGQGISLNAGSTPEFVCAGDTTLGSGPPLPYGESIEGGLLVCESEESGITCRDVETGRGFTISEQRYKLF